MLFQLLPIPLLCRLPTLVLPPTLPAGAPLPPTSMLLRLGSRLPLRCARAVLRGGAPSSIDDVFLGVKQGKSVTVLLDNLAYERLCCATVGSPGNNIVCIKPYHQCSTKAHQLQREKGTTRSLGSGIYVKAPGGDANIYTDPVGSLALLATHRSDILTYDEKNIGEWPILFNEWSQSVTSVEATAKRTSRKNAQIYRTPIVADRTSSASINLSSLFAEPPIKNEDVDEAFEIFTQLWKNAAVDEGTDLPPFDIKGFFMSQFKRSDAFGDAIEELVKEFAEHKRWCEESLKSTAQAISDVKISIGEPVSDWTYGATIWKSLRGLATQVDETPSRRQVQDNETAINNLEDEIGEMFRASKAFREKVETSIRNVNTKIGSSLPVVDDDQSMRSFIPQPSNSDIQALTAEIAALREEMKQKTSRIAALEEKMKLDEVSYRLTSGITLRGISDVSTWLSNIGAKDIDFGGFCDVYTLFIRIQKCIDGVGSVADYLKRRKDAMGVKLSEDEAYVIYGFQDTAPPIFGGARTAKSAIALLSSYFKWRMMAQSTGLAFTIENELQQIENTIRTIIYTNYQSLHSDLLSLAGEVITTAVSFARKYVQWVDSTYETMIHGGNEPDDVWELLTRVMRALFDEGLGPKRITPTGTTFETNLERTSVILWGVIKTHIATKELLLGDLRDQPIVTGNYAKWLVNHSGKKDALAVKKDVEKIAKSVEALREVAATKKALASVEGIANAAKKTADRAFNKQNS